MENQADRTLVKTTEAFNKLFRSGAIGGIVLILAATAAMIWANSSAGSGYFSLLNTPLAIKAGSFEISKSLLLWINDGLMTLFFFLIGLEIKREIMVGELSTARQAVVPVFAALGGMIVPAAIFLLLMNGSAGTQGWGIPMATDIAFSLGILSLLGKKVPAVMKIFMLAFAIVDDLGAVLVIAFFYSGNIAVDNLMIAGAFFSLLIILNYFDYRVIGVYVAVGIVIWFFMLKSGIHPTLAGVMVAMVIPARRKIKLSQFQEKIKKYTEPFSKPCGVNKVILNPMQNEAIQHIEEAIAKVQSPLQTLEHHLHGTVNYLIMPLFALANAGVVIAFSAESGPGILSLAIAIALFAGKMLGILFFSWIPVKMNIGRLPRGLNWSSLAGLGVLGGVGFTMSIFIAGLAFGNDPHMLIQAKTGILLGSFVSALAGFFLLKYLLRNHQPETERDC